MKTALITGATSGIGEACARRFARGGYHLILTGRNEAKLEELRTLSLKEVNPDIDVRTLVFDVRDREATTAAIKSLWDISPTGKFQDKGVDILINNAGLALGLEKEYEGDYDDWDTMIDTNIKGLLTMTRLVVPEMVKQGYGHVINIGSVAGGQRCGENGYAHRSRNQQAFFLAQEIHEKHPLKNFSCLNPHKNLPFRVI